ncbi:unnamed protein product [Notodromas monacha]|uniref:Uncharacterized protein n=1 Tax=Notodromas monacha TaxID=399045 RepID=A0A7R9BL79_9CRUS|nr:unnamed protein product [Notodromas monacha]CAG0916055.1 unnamed protein product [Notodromas monacha]
MSLMQYTTVPDTTKVLKFHAAAAQVYSADLSSRTPMRSSDRADYTGLRVGQIDTAMMQEWRQARNLSPVNFKNLEGTLGCTKTSARWAPHLLIEEQKAVRTPSQPHILISSDVNENVRINIQNGRKPEIYPL